MVVMINTRRLPVWVSGLKTWKDDVVVVATGCGLCGKPRRGFPSSARAERHVHADSRDAVDHVVGITPSPSTSSRSSGASHSGHAPPTPSARANKLQSPQR